MAISAVTSHGQDARDLEFLHFSRGAGRGESAIRELKIGNLKPRLSYR
jgi:hypothetical protein